MSTPTTERDLWALSSMTVAATSAAVASFSGLRGLASAAGWPEHLAWLLPVRVDAYAMTSTRLWLAGRTRHRRARRFAAANALVAIAGSVVGNAVYHAVSTGLLPVSWPIVISVGAVPATVLGLIAHLHALHGRTEPAGTAEAEMQCRPNLAKGPGRGRLLSPAPRPSRGRATSTAPSPSPGTDPVPDRHAGPVARPASVPGTEPRPN
jgi:hypothetical protein